MTDLGPGGAGIVEGDPASCSAFGGALRRRAAALRERRTALRPHGAGVMGWTGPAADAFTDRLRSQLGEVEAMAGRLDDVGAALQAYATDLAHAREQGELAAEDAARLGLVIGPGGAVRPAPGPASVETDRQRQVQLPQVQHQVDAAIGQARAAASRLRQRTSSAVGALRSDAGRLMTLDADAGMGSLQDEGRAAR